MSSAFTIRKLGCFSAWHALEDEPVTAWHKDFSGTVAISKCTYTPLFPTSPANRDASQPTSNPGSFSSLPAPNRKPTKFFRPEHNKPITLHRCSQIQLDYEGELHIDHCLYDTDSAYHSSGGTTTAEGKTSSSFGIQHHIISRENSLSSLSALELTITHIIKPHVFAGSVPSAPSFT
ncbi:hypothetical protein BDD12DRAFT_857493 [Trichophaea hybrida]|nr:hypothetical protein BDD12DRAFT_857493 [Trichophaea hybrida]